MEEQLPKIMAMEIQEKEPILLHNLPVRKSSDFMRLYGSIFSVSSTPLDMSVIIGQPIIEDTNDLHMEQRAIITMSWQAAKTLAELIGTNVKNYEQQFGEIQLGFLHPPSQPSSSD